MPRPLLRADDRPPLFDLDERPLFPVKAVNRVPRYYFSIRNGCGFTHDEEGMDLSSESEARTQAIRGARSLISAGVLEGMLDLDGQIEVTDDRDDRVLTIRFRDAVEVHHADMRGAADQ